MEKQKIWTAEETKWIIENYLSLGSKISAERLGRTEKSVISKAQKLSIGPKGIPWTSWTEEQLAWLKDNYLLVSIKEATLKLGKTEAAIRIKATRELKLTRYNLPPKDPNCKKCCTCKEEKPFTLFNKSNNSKDGLSWVCKECSKKRMEVYESKPGVKERKKERNRLRKINNKKEISAKAKIYSAKTRQRRNEYVKERRRTDPEFKLKLRLSGSIRDALKTAGVRKTDRTLKLTGCSISQLKIHIESQFEPEMTWDNHGNFGWNLDHIVASTTFNLTSPEEQLKCFHFTNLMPRWATTEIAKAHGSNQIGNIEKSDDLVDSSYYIFLENAS